jgi:uncharacterized membrane protein (DUF4010 family)
MLAFAGALTWFAAREAAAENTVSATGVVAGLLTYALGAYAVVGDQIVAVAAAVAMAMLLALRDPLHNWVRRLTWIELRSVLVLAAMSFLLLPVLPNRPVDPWGALNPAQIWFFAILIAAVSFVGYGAMKLFGEGRGLALAAIAGGLTSSTATTVSFSRLARDNPAGATELAQGVLLSGATMFARVGVLAGVIAPRLLPGLAPALAAATLAMLLTAAPLLMRGRASDSGPKLDIKNPFELTPVLQLAAIISIVLVLAKALADSASSAGVYILAAASGVADVDALTLSMARMAGDSLSLREANLAILIAVGVNTASKAALAAGIGGAAFAGRVAAGSLVALVAGGLAAWATA